MDRNNLCDSCNEIEFDEEFLSYEGMLKLRNEMKFIDDLLTSRDNLLGIVNHVDDGSIDVLVDDEKIAVAKIVVDSHLEPSYGSSKPCTR